MNRLTLDYLFEHWRFVLELSRDHLELSVSALLLAILVALPLSVLANRFPKLDLPLIGGLGIFYTFPSLAVLALLIPILGLGRTPAIVTLAAYAQVFLVRNAVAGLRSVDDATLEAAHGLGMAPWQVFWKVHLPIALPVMIAGVRIAFVAIVSLATITAWIDAGGLGTLLFNGISRNNPSMILAGTIAITALAILSDQVLRGLEMLTSISRARRAS